MSKAGRRRSYSPRRPHRSPSPAYKRSRSPPSRRQRRSPQRGGRASPDYSAYTSNRRRPPAWIDADISEDDIREQAGGDPVEFRRLKRLKLNERGIRSFWVNTPTPSPSPEHTKRRKTTTVNGYPLEDTGDDVDGTALHPVDQTGQLGAEGGAVGSIQSEILASGPEAVELHKRAAEVFTAWLAEEKAIAAEAERRRKQQEADNVLIGPVMEATEKGAVDYGTHMRPGEGTAMAAYVQSGKRIPRRGEVGMSADQITSFEELGYVMSGSRHNRMNAIRIRKENQVYTAEEKAALAMFNMEENKRKEQKILADMQRLVQRTLGEQDEEEEEEEKDGEAIEANEEGTAVDAK